MGTKFEVFSFSLEICRTLGMRAYLSLDVVQPLCQLRWLGVHGEDLLEIFNVLGQPFFDLEHVLLLGFPVQHLHDGLVSIFKEAVHPGDLGLENLEVTSLLVVVFGF